MHLQKGSTKLSNTLRIINTILLLALILVCVFGACCFFAVRKIPQLHYEQNASVLADQLSDTKEKIAALQILQKSGSTESDAALELAQKRLAAAQEEIAALTVQRNEIKELHDSLQDPARMQLIIAELRTEYGTTVRQLEDRILAGESDYKICYLTFDDGPSLITHDFLDTLDELDVYATFFTTGVCIADKDLRYLRDECLIREAREGHTIANHTYSHDYPVIYRNLENFMSAIQKQDDLVFGLTGIHTDIVRFPSGSHYCQFRDEAIQALTDEGYVWMDWIGNAYDTGIDRDFNSITIANTVIWQARQDDITVILMHDWNHHSGWALKQIVNTLRAENYLFLPLFKESSTNCSIQPKWG